MRPDVTIRVAAMLFASAAGLHALTIGSVEVSKPFFNPSLGQRISITFAPTTPGDLSVLILDRDGYPVRILLARQSIKPGPLSLEWDGRDDHGIVVPDEAYSLKIDLTAAGQTATYFPAKTPPTAFSVTQGYYDRRTAVLGYKLPTPARVHIQAGTATLDARTGKPNGPVLKTVVNREPRPAGAVIENWNGFDESGTAYIPDLPHFLTAIAGTSLPENALLTTGNRTTTFLASAGARTGTSLLSPVTSHEHHAGLTALQDVAPRLHATVTNARWSPTERLWHTRQDLLLEYRLDGPSATAFAQEPADLFVFIDRKKIKTIPSPQDGQRLQIPVAGLAPGPHVLALNWTSTYGPVAVNTLRFQTGRPPAVRTAAK
jgi:hypothetical protein